MQASEAWAWAQKWVEGNKRKIRGYVEKRYLLCYSAYEMQDFLSEAYLVAYDTLMSCDDVLFEAYFWVSFRNRFKTLANKPHEAKLKGDLHNVCTEVDEGSQYDESVLTQYLSILTPKQREAFASPVPLNISRQALQQRIGRAVKMIAVFAWAIGLTLIPFLPAKSSSFGGSRVQGLRKPLLYRQ